MDALKALLKQPYWVIALVFGVALVSFPCLTVDTDYHLTLHPPTTLLPVVLGIALLVLSSTAFGFPLLAKRTSGANALGGLDLKRVTEANGALWTNVSGCRIQLLNGRIEEYRHEPGAAIVLPCNEYFDDRCVGDMKSSLGAYVNRTFEGQVAAFAALIKDECRKKMGAGVAPQKTDEERAVSFGAGRCLLLTKPLGIAIPVFQLLSYLLLRSELAQGLAPRISYLFDGMGELFTHLADARIDEVVMPIMGSGHGQIARRWPSSVFAWRLPRWHITDRVDSA
jgi:hypothetical protein